MKITIYWVTRDWNLIRKLRDKYKIPQYTTVNGLTEAEVNEETLSNLRKGEPKYLIIRKIEQSDKFSYISKFHILISYKLTIYIVMCFYQGTN